MHDWDSDDKLAAAANLPAMDELRREALLEATSRLVRARRRWRVAAQLAAIVLAFVSGMVVMSQLRGPIPTTPKPNTAATFTPAPKESSPLAVPDTDLFDDPEAFARAFDAASRDEQLAMLRAAGDYELKQHEDVRTALAYYDQWVKLADKSQRTDYDGNDTWLLASLKHGD